MKEQLEQIKQYMKDHEAEMMAQYEEFVNMQDFWRDVDDVNAVGEWLKKNFEAEGFDCRLIDVGDKAGRILTGTLGAERGGKPIIFAGHMDTALSPDLFEENPFRVEDGKVYGPGVLDMKGGILISLYVAKALNAIGYNERPIKILYVGDEEGCHLYSDCSPLIVEESKGGLFAFNMETGLPDNALCIGRKGRIGIDIFTTGIEAHAGNDFTAGISAIEEMAHKILELQALTDLEAGTTVNVGVVKGGTIANAIPAECMISVDIRFTTMAEKERIEKALKDVCSMTFVKGTSTRYELTTVMAPYETTDGVKKLFGFVNETAEKFGLPVMDGRVLGGCSDAAYTTIAGTPCLCSCGVRGEWNHTVREYAIAESMGERVVLWSAAILNAGAFEA